MFDTRERFYSAHGKRQILIAEDELINREILGAILEEDFVVIYAEDGEDTLRIIEEHKDTLSLILLDLNMPKVSGQEVLKQIKDDPVKKNIPVIVLTAEKDAEVESLLLGAVDFIPKPYPEPRIILARVIRTIELFEDRDLIRSTERDNITGLYNKEYFYKYIEQFDIYHDTSTDAAVLDINHFHIINDRFGMSYGDRLLRQIADNLKAYVHNIGGMVCRKEADMFLIYAPTGIDYKDLIDKVKVDLSRDETTQSQVRLRVGVYADTDRSISIESRFDRAKMAADLIRNNLTKNVEYYDDSLRKEELYVEQLIDDFKDSIRDGHFVVYYQPKFDIRPREAILSSAEALVRWVHPEFGMISPGTFISIFEGNGLIQQLDNFVWNSAARQIREWKDKYGFSVPVSVNVSRIDLYDPDLIDTLTDIIMTNRIEPSELLLEITESAYTDDSDTIVETLDKLRGLGFRIEMDDFGSGYSSLNMLSTLPIDVIKLDMKFIKSAFSMKKDTRMLEVIIDMAKYLEVPVIAEGVETKEQLDALKAIGCDIVQGYYFSRPLPPEEFESFLEKRKEIADEMQSEWDNISGKKEETLSGISFSSIAQALSQDYFSIYYVDTETDWFIEYSSDKEYESLGIEKGGEDFFNLSRKNIERVIFPEDREDFLRAFTKENILEELKSSKNFTLNYRLMFDGVPTYVSMKATKISDKTDKHIVIGVNNIDSQMKREKAILTYSSISKALSADYFSIYFVNTENDDFIEYSSHEGYEALGIEKKGTDFFATSRRNILRVAHPDDVSMLISLFTKDKVMATVDEGKTFTMTYRLMFGNTPTYVHLKATKLDNEEGKFLVVGVSNIDEQVRREKEHQEAEWLAKRDSLTELWNKHAYSEEEARINEDISEKKADAEPFAVAVCDVNGLKQINDNLGHKAGDMHIIGAADILRSIFADIPIYRIGGDEFAVILKGESFGKSESLRDALYERSLNEKASGGIVIACGLGIFDPEKDSSFAEVFERADERMYENKKLLKS